MLVNHLDNTIVPTDPDWLLSSTAQSAAVLVAIIGGFLASRLITLWTERNATIQRRQELIRRQEILQTEYDEVHGDRFKVSVEWFTEKHQEKLLKASGNIETDILLEWIPRGSSEQELRPAAEFLVATTRAAFSDIESKFTGKMIPPWGSDELRRAGISVPESAEAEEVYKHVAIHIAKDRVPPSPFGFYLPTSSVSKPAIVYQRQDARIDLERQLGSQLKALASEIALLEEQLGRFERPDGVIGTIIALTYLALVGIVLPTILMALRPVPSGPVSRIAVVGSFVSGLAVLLGYFMLRSKRLRPPE